MENRTENGEQVCALDIKFEDVNNFPVSAREKSLLLRTMSNLFSLNCKRIFFYFSSSLIYIPSFATPLGTELFTKL